MEPMTMPEYLRLNIGNLQQQKAEAEERVRMAQAHLNQVIGALAMAEQTLAGIREAPESTGDALATGEETCPAST